MSTNLKVPFGIRDGALVTPTEVCSGLKCMCVCPGCGDRLVANHTKASTRRDYFSHYAGSSCSTGYESALHLAAKRVLVESKKILVPGIEVSRHYHDRANDISTFAEKAVQAKTIALDHVEEEVRQFDGIIPDIVAQTQGKTLLIEIAVTHYVDEAKLEKLKRLPYAVLEISLEPSSSVPNLEEVRELVLNTSNNRKWLVNPRIMQLQLEADTEAHEEAKRILRARESYKLLPEKQKFAIELKRANTSLRELGNKIGKRVTGGNSFGVSNQLWQLFVYRKFIQRKEGDWFHADDVFFTLDKRFTVIEVFKDSPKIAIYYYLQHLEELKLVRRSYGKNYEVIAGGFGF